MNGRALRTVAVLLAVMLLGACTAQAVKCDGHLVPINAPHPKPAVEPPK